MKEIILKKERGGTFERIFTPFFPRFKTGFYFNILNIYIYAINI